MWQLIVIAPFVLNGSPFTLALPIGQYANEKSCVLVKRLIEDAPGTMSKLKCEYLKVEGL